MAVTRSTFIKVPIFLLLAAVALFAAYVWVALHWSFSKGERAGYVQKFSQKGWLCKTWEGELQMVPVPGAAPEIFRFTVRDDAVAQKINGSVGRKVTLQYEQHKGVPTSCFGDTQYYIVDMKSLE